MPFVILFLIIFFIFIVLYQLFLAHFNDNIIEGLTNNTQYQPYDTNNPNNALILAQQNAGNINYLNQKFSEISNLQSEVQDLSGNVANLQTQVNGIVQAQQQYATNMAPSSPPNISGTNDASNNSVS
jgi:TolA-binding protein